MPSPSRSRAKQSLPVLRWKITRPVIATRSPVRVSGSSSCPSYFSLIWRTVWVRSTTVGYAGTPSGSRCRFSRRTRFSR